jgi:hypothetical protein
LLYDGRESVSQSRKESVVMEERVMVFNSPTNKIFCKGDQNLKRVALKTSSLFSINYEN